MTTQDEEIARHLREAADSGELAGIAGYGKPLAEIPGWVATPDELRMPFRILKNAGYAPPGVELFHQRAELVAALQATTDPAVQAALRARLAELQQKIAIRLEALRRSGTL